jgi:hypothetical protein
VAVARKVGHGQGIAVDVHKAGVAAPVGDIDASGRSSSVIQVGGGDKEGVGRCDRLDVQRPLSGQGMDRLGYSRVKGGEIELPRLDVLGTVAKGLADLNFKAVGRDRAHYPIHAVAAAGVQFDAEKANVAADLQRLSQRIAE